MFGSFETSASSSYCRNSFEPYFRDGKESYTLIYAEEKGKVTSACGFRYLTTLFEGRFIYIDDLTTAPEFRGKAMPEPCLTMW
ncbi:MAG: hypothetical protein IPH28_06685 [Cytophagaceae bacterium]|nr:hypothetical protein [Cytophagaceae bacterium]